MGFLLALVLLIATGHWLMAAICFSLWLMVD